MTPTPDDEHSGLPSSSYQFATHSLEHRFVAHDRSLADDLRDDFTAPRPSVELD